MKDCLSSLVVLLCLSQAHGIFPIHLIDQFKHDFHYARHQYHHFLHHSEQEIKKHGLKMVTTALIPDLVTGAPTTIALDLLKGFGEREAVAELKKTKVGRKVDAVLDHVGKEVKNQFGSVLPSSHVDATVNKALRRTMSKAKKSVEIVEGRLNISLPSATKEMLLTRTLASGAVAAHIRAGMTEKLSQDLALHTHHLVPMDSSKLPPLKRGFHVFLIAERQNLESRVAAILREKGFEGPAQSAEEFVDKLVLNLPNFVRCNLPEFLEESSRLFSVACLEGRDVSPTEQSRLQAAIQHLLRLFLNDLQFSLRQLLVSSAVALNDTELRELVEHGLRNAYYPVLDTHMYLAQQMNLIVKALMSQNASYLHVPAAVIEAFVHDLLRNVSRAVEKEIPKAVASSLLTKGVPIPEAVTISDSVHKFIVHQFFRRRVDCSSDLGGKAVGVKMHLHMDAAIVRRQKALISAQIAREVSRTLNINHGDVAVEKFEASEHGTTAAVKIFLCRDPRRAGDSRKATTSKETSVVRKTKGLSVPVILAISASISLVLVFAAIAICKARARWGRAEDSSTTSPYRQLTEEV